MEKLNALDDHQSNSQYPISRASNKVFGIIKRECNAAEFIRIENNNAVVLKPGAVIETISDYHGDDCPFTIRSCTNWLDKYSTTIYKCSKDDYIMDTRELCPYLLALENDEERIEFFRKVCSGEFDLDMLCLGREIHIRAQADATVKYYKFEVTHNGEVKDNGAGYYIGLQCKNDHVTLTSDLNHFSKNYRFGGTGIVVPANWVMLNLYKEEDCQPDLMDFKSSTNIFETVAPRLEISEKAESCSICFGTFRQQIELKVCGHEFCQQCIQAIVTVQESNGSAPTCPMCRKPIGHSQIAVLKELPSALNAEVFQLTRELNTPLQLNNHPFECIICEQNIGTERGVVLANCGDSLCRNCISDGILRQSTNRLTPNCPVCQTRITDEEIRKLDTGVYDRLMENRLALDSNGSSQDETTSDNAYEILITSNASDKPIRNQKSNLIISENVDNCSICLGTLRQRIGLKVCGHEFCQQCIQASVTVQESNETVPTCPMCRKPIEHDQIIVLKELSAALNAEVSQLTCELNTSLQLNNHPFECIICEQNIDSECGVVLANCGDSLCRNCISDVILRQSMNNLIPNCPVCQTRVTDVEISTLKSGVLNIVVENHLNRDSSVRRDGFEMPGGDDTRENRKSNSEMYTKADICSVCCGNFRQRISLANCGHNFCQQCIQACITEQQSNETMPICPLCHKPIRLDQIIMLKSLSMPANEEDIQVQLNFEPNTPLRLNNHPFECAICDLRSTNLNSQCGVTLANCGDSLCRDCISATVLQQSANNLAPNCPVCKTRITDEEFCMINPGVYKMFVKNRQDSDRSSARYEFEVPRRDEPSFDDKFLNQVVVRANRKSISKISEKTDTCSLCAEEFQQRLVLQDCGHEFCQQCIQAYVTKQQSNKTVPTCPMCHQAIKPDEILMPNALSSASNVDVLQMNLEPNTPLRLNNQSFECVICKQIIETECGVIFANCGDSLCRDCITDVIFQQSENSPLPYCPLCQKPITDEEFLTLDPGVYDIFMENKIDFDSSAGRNEFDKPRHDETDPIDFNEIYFCVICEQTIDSNASKVLSFCRDRLCRPCITVALNDQSLINKMPSCPLCSHEVADSDIIDLCGMESFKRFMDNKQNNK